MKNDFGLGGNQKKKTIIPNERMTSYAISRCNRGTKRKGALIVHLRCKKQAFSSSSQLPLDDLLPNILKWLPLESLCRFKCVSKTWRSFIISHFHGLKRRPIVAMLYEHEWIEGTPQLNCFGLCSIDAQTGIAHPRWNRAVKFSGVNYTTFNGLFCLSTTFTNNKLAIYNPFTQEKPLLLPRKIEIDCFSRCTFGFDPLSKRYKVFVWTDYPNCLMHTVGTKSWKRIKNSPPTYKIGSKPNFQSVCINGVVYLLCRLTDTVISFNLSSECFGTLEDLPSALKRGRISCIFEFEGCFSFTYQHANYPHNYDLWMFKNNTKWVLVTSVVPPAEGITACEPYPTRTGEIILAHSTKGSRVLYAYSILTGQFDTIEVIGLDSKVDYLVTNYVESSQSLKDL